MCNEGNKNNEREDVSLENGLLLSLSINGERRTSRLFTVTKDYQIETATNSDEMCLLKIKQHYYKKINSISVWSEDSNRKLFNFAFIYGLNNQQEQTQEEIAGRCTEERNFAVKDSQ